jgi:hypothetical protein
LNREVDLIPHEGEDTEDDEEDYERENLAVGRFSE